MRPRPGIRSFEFWNRNFPRENFNYFPGIHYSMLIDTCPTFFLLFFLIFFKTRSDMNIARHAMATLLLPFLSFSLLRPTSFFRVDSQTFLPFRIHRIVNFTERERSRKGWYRGINAGLNYHFTNRRVIIGFITDLYGVLSLAQVSCPFPSSLPLR